MYAADPLSPPPPAPGARIGALLRGWRSARSLSQLDLAYKAEVSPRHLSFIETGRAQPSREMVMRIAGALDIPLRERNALLLAAGYAPGYPQTKLAAPEMARARRAIDFILNQQNPYPAIVVNRHWDYLQSNEGAVRFFGHLLGEPRRHGNMMHQVFDPSAARRAIVNWDEVGRDLIQHLHNDVAAAPWDERSKTLLTEVLAYPGVPSRWRTRELGASTTPLLTAIFRRGTQEFRLFSTITTFGTPHDVTLEELRIECWFPADEETAEVCRTLMAG